MHVNLGCRVYLYMPKRCLLMLCVVMASCSYKYDRMSAPSEIAAARRLQGINVEESGFRTKRERFGTLDELNLENMTQARYAGYQFTLQLRPNGYVIEARPYSPSAGQRSFYSDETTVIHEAWGNRPATASDPPLQLP
jgi:hypothetical protein